MKPGINSRIMYNDEIGIVVGISPSNLLYSQTRYMVRWGNKTAEHLESFIMICILLEEPNTLLKEIL